MKRAWYRFLYATHHQAAKIGLGILAVLLSIAVLLFLGVIEERRMEAQTASWDGQRHQKAPSCTPTTVTPVSRHRWQGTSWCSAGAKQQILFTQRIKDVGWAGSLQDYVELTVAAGRPSKVNARSQIMPTWSNRFGDYDA